MDPRLEFDPGLVGSSARLPRHPADVARAGFDLATRGETGTGFKGCGHRGEDRRVVDRAAMGLARSWSRRCVAAGWWNVETDPRTNRFVGGIGHARPTALGPVRRHVWSGCVRLVAGTDRLVRTVGARLGGAVPVRVAATVCPRLCTHPQPVSIRAVRPVGRRVAQHRGFGSAESPTLAMRTATQ